MESEIYVYLCPDFDHEVIDVMFRYNTAIMWVKGFDDIEYQLAERFAQAMADDLGVTFAGEIVENTYDHTVGDEEDENA